MAVAQLWDTLTHAIAVYTGLSPAVFFTVLAVAATIYYVLSGIFAAPPAPTQRAMDFPPSDPLPPPVQLGEITEEELKQYDGSDPKKPLLMAIKGQIYDVSQSRVFYGPGGPYALFAGKDASRALAKMSFEAKDLTGDISGLGPFELDALQDWEYKFMSKYVKVGTVKKPAPVEDHPTGDGASKDADASTGSDEPKEVPAGATKDADASAGSDEPKEVRAGASKDADASSVCDEPKEVPAGASKDTDASSGSDEPKEVPAGSSKDADASGVNDEPKEVHAVARKESADEILQPTGSSSVNQPESSKE